MTDVEIRYETNTVHSIRGMESRTVTKWESEGWELVSQTPGKLRTEFVFRRPKSKTRWLPWAIGGGAVAVVLATIITIGTISERNAAETPAAVPSASSSPSREASTAPSESPSSVAPTVEASPELDVVLTAENTAEFAALLSLTDYCDPSIAAFAASYRGRTVAFPGNIGAMALRDGATSRYDLLIIAGDFSETSAPGPAFQFRDVNTTYDLHFVGTTPDTIGVGTNLGVTAEVRNYEASSCLFLLDPVSTSVR